MTTTPGPVVRVAREGGLAIVTLDHPPLNLFSQAVLDALADALVELTERPPRALLLRGAGDVTSGGVDVSLFEGATSERFAAGASGSLERIVQPLQALPCPTIAACHGLCLTAAFELALACDLILAARSTQFGLVEASLGLTPAMGGTQRLAAKVGLARATELVVLSRLYDAQTMLDWGAVNRVVDDERLQESAEKLARRLAEGPTLAHAATKQVLAAWATGGVPAADAVTPRLAGDLFASEDLEGGIRSFLAHGPGKATFQGR